MQVLPPDRPLQLPPAAMANGSIRNVHPHEVRMDVNGSAIHHESASWPSRTTLRTSRDPPPAPWHPVAVAQSRVHRSLSTVLRSARGLPRQRCSSSSAAARTASASRSTSPRQASATSCYKLNHQQRTACVRQLGCRSSTSAGSATTAILAAGVHSGNGHITITYPSPSGARPTPHRSVTPTKPAGAPATTTTTAEPPNTPAGSRMQHMPLASGDRPPTTGLQ